MISRSVPFSSQEQSMPRSPHVMKANGTRSLSSDPVRPSNDDFTPDHQCCSESSLKNTLFCFSFDEEMVKIIPEIQILAHILKHLKNGTQKQKCEDEL